MELELRNWELIMKYVKWRGRLDPSCEKEEEEEC